MSQTKAQLLDPVAGSIVGADLATNVDLVDNQKIRFGTDNDLEIYHSGSHGFLHNNVGRIRFEADNLGFGFYKGAGAETVAMFNIDAECSLYYNNGKVFETTSTGSKVSGRLEVTGGLTDGIGRWDEFENGSTSPSLQVSGTDLNSSCQAWIRATADAGAPKIFLANTRSTSAGGHGAVLNGDELGGIFFAGSDGTEFVNGASITSYVHNTPGANDMPGSLYFSTTNDGAASPTLRQKITAYGEVWFNASSATYGETYKFYNPREDDGMLIHQNTSNDYSGVIMRHGRGLSGYNGRMVNFKRNDGTTVGSIDIGASSTGYNTSSDYRLKENQVTITNASAKINQLKPYEFNFKDDPDYKYLGFFAHEVQEVLPQAGIVTGTKDAVEEDGSIKAQSVDYSKLTPLLTAALQEAITKIETLETEKTKLQTDLTDLTARVAALEAA